MSNYFVLSALYASLWAHSTPRINGNYVNSHFKTPFGKAHLFMINFPDYRQSSASKGGRQLWQLMGSGRLLGLDKICPMP